MEKKTLLKSSSKKKVSKTTKKKTTLNKDSQWQKMLNILPEGFLVVDLKGNIKYISEHIVKLHGYTNAEEILGRKIFEFVVPNYLEKAKTNFLELIAGKNLGSMEFLLYRRDGTKFYAELSSTSVKSARGKITNIILLERDISGRKNSERIIREREQYLNSILHTTVDGFWVVNSKGIFEEVNNAYCKMSGYSRDEFIGMRINQIDVIENPRDTREKMDRIKNRGYEIFETSHRRKDGTIFPVELSVNYLNIDDGKYIVFCRDLTQRKRYEQEIRESKEQLHSIANNLVDGMIYQVVALDERSRKFTYVSDSVKKMYGFTPDEIYADGSLIYSRTHKDDIERIIEEENRALKNLSIFKTEIRVMNPDGTYRWSYISSKPRLVNGTIFWDGVEIDITERKKNEQALKISEEKYKALFEQSFLGIYLHDFDGKIIDVNEMACKQSGYTRDELLRMTIFDCHPKIQDSPNLPEDVIRKMWREWSNGFRFVREAIHQRKDGTIYPVEISTGSIIYSDSSFMLAMVQDITDRKKIEIERSKLFDIIENSLNEIYIFDSENLKFEFVNKGAIKNIGYTLDELLNMTPVDIKPFISFEEFNKLINPLKTGEKDKLIFTTVHRRKDNTDYDVEVHLQLFKQNERGVFFAIINDITKRKITENELMLAKEKAEESDKLKSAFLANMSHEIRTPINGILGFTDLLKVADLTKENQNHYINIIEKSGRRLLNIINDLVNISKIEAGQMDVHLSDVDVVEQLEYLYNFFKREAEQKGLQFALKYLDKDKRLVIRTDREKFNSILENLLKNSIKYTHKGSIEFGFTQKDEFYEFYVRDTGIGIPANKQKEVFDRFIQVDSSSSSGYEGAGLGLAICKGYIEMLGGEIRVESEVNKGSCFYFTLPAASKIEKEVNEKRTENIQNDKDILINKTILVAEDDDVSLSYLSTILSDVTNKLLYAKTGQEAVEMCQSDENIDLVLMDIKMPIMDGYTAAKKIKEFRPELKIIAQTAYAMENEKERYRKIFDDYITKPIQKRELINVLMKILK